MKITKHIIGDKTEYLNEKGLPHRDDGPAIEYKDGFKYWYQNGKLHRLDGPAAEMDNRYWWFNGRASRFWSEDRLRRHLNKQLKKYGDIKKYVVEKCEGLDPSEMFLLKLVVGKWFSDYKEFVDKVLMLG